MAAHLAITAPTIDNTIHHSPKQESDAKDGLRAALLPAHYGAGVDMSQELLMLRHKLRALQTYSRRHGIAAFVPVLSEAEEARYLQYQCECIETACLDRGIDLCEAGPTAELQRELEHDAPSGFPLWLEKNLTVFDPVVRGWSMRYSLPSPPCHSASAKCWDDRCLHYIYGFRDPGDRDAHAREHKVPMKRDSGLSLGGISPGGASLTPPSYMLHGPGSGPNHGLGLGAPSAAPSLGIPRPRSGAYSSPLMTHGTQYAPGGRNQRDGIGRGRDMVPERVHDRGSMDSIGSLFVRDCEERREAERDRGIPHLRDLAAFEARGGRSSIDSDVDPLLPPLKRSRVGHPRLESIDELKLPRETAPCLRCRLSNAECDRNEPCSGCADSSQRSEHDLFTPLGCHRAKLAALADTILPGPRHALLPTPASPQRIRRAALERVDRACRDLDPQLPGALVTRTDFEDAFWWGENAGGPGPDGTGSLPTGLSYWAPRSPSLLASLATSHKTRNAPCNVFYLLQASGLLSQTRQLEGEKYPVLYHAKTLLREVLVLEQLPRPPAQPELWQQSSGQRAEESGDLDASCGAVHESLRRFLQAFDDVMAHGGVSDPRTWLSVFMALCLLSIVEALLADVAWPWSLPPSWPLVSSTSSWRPLTASVSHATSSGDISVARDANASRAVVLGSVHKVLVTLLTQSSQLHLDAALERLVDEDASLVSAVDLAFAKSSWASRGLASGADFLLRIGVGGGLDGFVVQARSSASGAGSLGVRLPMILEPGSTNEAYGPPPLPPLPTYKPAASGLAPVAEAPARDQPVLAASGPIIDDREGSHLRCSPERMTGPPQPTDRYAGRRHTFTGAYSSTGEPTQPLDGAPSPFISSVRSRHSYQRPPLRRVFCTKCSEHPEGFRGDHELRRHADAKHAALVRRWVCVQPHRLQPGSRQPLVPLSKCKACVTRKRYGAYYNAAAHLRRAHFQPHRAGKSSGDWPPMAILKDWMQEVQQPLSTSADDDAAAADENDLSSGDEDDEEKLPPVSLASAPNHRVSLPLASPGVAPTVSLPGLDQQTPGTSSTGLAAAPIPYIPPLPLPPLGASQPLAAAAAAASPAPSTLRPHYPASMAPILPSGSGLGAGVRLPGPHLLDSITGPSGGVVSMPGTQVPVPAPGARSRCPHPECGRVFKDMAAHMLTHQEERPEKCPIASCEYHTKGFARKYDKNRHALTHYRGTMVCPFCPGTGTGFEKAFNRADVFKRHLTAVHNVEQAPPNGRKQQAPPRADSSASTLFESAAATSGHSASGSAGRASIPSGSGPRGASLASPSGEATPGSKPFGTGSAGLATDSLDGAIDASSAQDAGARCSICRCVFNTAQDFYEHLDECVLNEIVPTAPKQRQQQQHQQQQQQPRQRGRPRQRHQPPQPPQQQQQPPQSPTLPKQRSPQNMDNDTPPAPADAGLKPKVEPPDNI